MKGHFGLYNNDLTSTVPTELGSMTTLTQGLNLYMNSLTGPVNWGMLKNLNLI